MHWLYEVVLVLVMGAFGLAGAVMVVHGYFMLRNRVPYVVLPPGAMRQVVEALDLQDGDAAVDLGCGDGRVLRRLRWANKRARLLGVENDWVVWLAARLWTPRAQIRRGDIEDIDLHGVTKVFCYLGPEMMARLEPKFERELPAGARVVSVQFALPNRPADQVTDLNHSASHAAILYVYNY